MILENQVFVFKIDLSDKSLEPTLITVYEEYKRRIERLKTTLPPEIRVYDRHFRIQLDNIRDDLKLALSPEITGKKINIPQGYDENKIIFFTLDNSKFDVEIVDALEDVKIILWAMSDCVNILGTVGDKFLFNRVVSGEVQPQTFLIKSDKISYLNKFV